MIGRAIGTGISAARDAIARRLVKIGVRPNTLTLIGVAFTSGAGFCYAAGASHRFAWSLAAGSDQSVYLLFAGLLLLLASACDMLDGAVARIGGASTRFGAFLDSTTDRFSDFAVYAGIGVHYAWARPGNVTFVLLAMLGFFAAFMISYTRARAEDLIERCRVGYWQRGERSAAILIATFAHNIPALLVQQAFFPLLTALRRLLYTKAVIEGRGRITDPRDGGLWVKIRLWRWARMTIPYDLVTGLNIAWLIFARFEPVDVIRRLWGA